jgi:hypothetical protein
VNPATASGAVEEAPAPPDRLSRSSMPPAPPAAEARAARARLALLVALLAGAALRLLQYAVNRSLWLDEALLAANYLPRPWSGLLQPLHRGQTAPLGFLALEKLAATLLGPSEYALRLLPLLAGLATLALLPAVARWYVGRRALPLAVALVALAPFLVYYSSEAKPYALDALASVVVLGLAARLAHRPGDRGIAAGFAAVGVAAPWLSQPVVFMLAGTGLVLGARALRRGDRRALAVLAALAATWALSFAGSYLVARHEVEDPEYMRAFWRTGFMPLPPRSAADWVWLPRMLARVFREPLGILGHDRTPVATLGAVAAGIAFVLGCVAMWRRRRLALALLLAPAALTLAASAVKAYPFGAELQAAGRVLVFLLPCFALVMAYGAAALPRLLGQGRRRGAYLAGAALLLLPSLAYALQSVPHLRNEVKPLLAYAAEQRRPGDVMYVYYNGLPSYEYYAPRYGWGAAETVRGVCSRLRPEGYLEDLSRLRGRARVWVLVVEGAPIGDFDEKVFMVNFLEHVGRRLDDRVTIGAALYLYDLRPRATGPFSARIPHLPLDPGMDCRGAWGPLPGETR